MDLSNKDWVARANIRNQPGWYFIRTDAPVEVLSSQNLWAPTYTREDGKTARVLNYNIAARARRYKPDLSEFWNVTEVYSGMHGNLRARAQEHTLPNAGTGALALGKYPELAKFEWLFFFAPMERFRKEISCSDMLLRLGEQMWRAENGWPLLCAR